jgi:hypothetical protein
VKIYLASSWRNPYQPNAVEVLRQAGHEVYDFRHPPGGDHLGFSWSDVDPEWRRWNVDGYLRGIRHPIAVAGFDSDFGAMQWADAGVLLLPCGRSAHLEAGWMIGQGKPTWIVLDPAELPTAEGESNPELMYRMATGLVSDLGALLDSMARYEAERPPCPVRSGITLQPCLLREGHEQDSATRYHRYEPIEAVPA